MIGAEPVDSRKESVTFSRRTNCTDLKSIAMIPEKRVVKETRKMGDKCGQTSRNKAGGKGVKRKLSFPG